MLLPEISIHALREEGDGTLQIGTVAEGEISIHALREEGDCNRAQAKLVLAQFLSTPSARRATDVACVNANSQTLFLSTPSARRATRMARASTSLPRNFYPRPPRGGRQVTVGEMFGILGFLSTPSARRATRPRASSSTSRRFLSTPSARRATWICARTPVRGSGFLSTPSARRATDVRVTSVEKITYFYPRPPRGGRRQWFNQNNNSGKISIHALREEGDVEPPAFLRFC